MANGQLGFNGKQSILAPGYAKAVASFPISTQYARETHARHPTADVGMLVVQQRKQHLFQEGEPATNVYFVKSGTFLAYRVTSSGRRIIPAIYVSGAIIGFDARTNYSTSCIALETATVRACKKTALLSLMGSDELLRESVWTQILKHREEDERYACLLGASAMARLCGFILRMAGQGQLKARADLPLSRREIADHLCLTVETVSRIFTQLRGAKVIRYEDPRALTILNHSYLLRHAEA